MDCTARLWNGDNRSGKKWIHPFKNDRTRKLMTICDQNTDNGGGWTTILQRDSSADITANFDKTYAEYENGFGHWDHDFWIGLQAMHQLTQLPCTELRIEMTKYDEEEIYIASYTTFKVGSKAEGYKLTLGDFSSTPSFPDDFKSRSNGMKFSTKDMDQDTAISNCAANLSGGWWFSKCFGAKFTGRHFEGKHKYSRGIHWKGITGLENSFKKVSMKIRRSRIC